MTAPTAPIVTPALGDVVYAVVMEAAHFEEFSPAYTEELLNGEHPEQVAMLMDLCIESEVGAGPYAAEQVREARAQLAA